MPYDKIFLVVLLFGLRITNAQVNRYMVFFKDKEQSTYSVTAPLEFLSQKAIDRRTRQNVAITENDLPVNQSYIEALSNTGASVFFKTRWQNGALIQCDQSIIPLVSALDFVKAYELVAPGEKLLAAGRKEFKKKDRSVGRSLSTTTVQLKMLGVDSMHYKGYHGEGITIAILDAGFPGVDVASPFDSIRIHERIDLEASYDFIKNTENVFQYDDHGTKALSTIAAYIPDQFVGSAYRSNFQLYVTEDDPSEYRIEEYNWLFAAERADSAGADIISTSLGYNTFDDPAMDYQKSQMNGTTAVISRAAQAAADRGILVVCSAGNEGNNSWKIITAPADAKDVIAVANVNALGIRSSSSSIGPTADGRIKPDLAALGTNVAIIMPTGDIATASGTSFAAPLLAGLAAGVWQHYPELTNKDLITLLKNNASQTTHPDNALGYGIPDFNAIEKYYSNKPVVPERPVVDIYPNPFKDTVNIFIENPPESIVCQLDILSRQGQLVDSQLVDFNWFSPKAQPDLEALASGLYFFRISCGKNIYVIKVVKR